MQAGRILKKEKISTGIRLKQLIDSKWKKHGAFLKDLEVWKKQQSKYDEVTMPDSKDLSRWLNGHVQMRKDKIQMFADYFGVDFEYLNCAQIEPNKTLDQATDVWNQFDQCIDIEALTKGAAELEKFLNLLDQMNYKVDFRPSSIETDVYQYLDNKEIYTVAGFSTSSCAILITYPDGSELEITEPEFKSMLTDFKKYIDFSMDKIKS